MMNVYVEIMFCAKHSTKLEGLWLGFQYDSRAVSCKNQVGEEGILRVRRLNFCLKLLIISYLKYGCRLYTKSALSEIPVLIHSIFMMASS